jgi:hypothetical protein
MSWVAQGVVKVVVGSNKLKLVPAEHYKITHLKTVYAVFTGLVSAAVKSVRLEITIDDSEKVLTVQIPA